MITSENVTSNNPTEELLKKYPKEQKYALAAMQDIQKIYRYIPRESMNMLSKYLNLPLSRLYSMATFYKSISLIPKGENLITVCDGTACHIRSSSIIIDELEKKLGIKPGETTGDGKFTLETVNCLGSCAIAPVMVVNNKYYGRVTPSKVREIIREYGGELDEQSK